MYCNKCGSPMAETARFCPRCGALNPRAAQADSPVQNAAPTASTPVPEAGSTAWSSPSVASAGMPSGAYQKGCLAQAFDDITKVPAAFQRVLKIAFVPGIIAVISTIAFIIPVVGWAVGVIGLVLSGLASLCAVGYAIEWGRALPRGRGFEENAPLLRTSLLSLGFFSNALNGLFVVLSSVPLIIGIVFFLFTVGTGATASILGYGVSRSMANFVFGFAMLVLVVAVIISIVLSVLLTMFSDATVMHMAVSGRVESTFSLGKVLAAYKREPGKLFCASILPGIIVGIVQFIVDLILGAFASGALGVWLQRNTLGDSFGAFIALIPLLVSVALLLFVTMCSGAFTSVLKFRALGYWAERYAPAWLHEGDDDFALPLSGTTSASSTSR